MNNANSVPFFSKLLTIWIIIAPFFIPYGMAGITLALYSYVVLVLISVVSVKWKVKYIYNQYLPYVLYLLFVLNCVSLFKYSNIDIPTPEILIFLVLCLSKKWFNIEFGIKVYKVAIYFVCIVFLLQETCYYATGVRFSALMPFLPLIYTTVDMSSFISGQILADRSSSIFLEPAQMAQYIIPYYVITLFKSNSLEKFNWEIFFLIFILILLQSGNGLLVCGIISIIWLLKIKKTKSNIGKIILLLFLCILFIAWFKGTLIGDDIFNRIGEFSPDDSNTSGYYRIFRGYELWLDLDITDKLFGIQSSQLARIINTLGAGALFDNEIYLNTFQSKLIYSGIFGTIIYFMWIFKEINSSSYIGKFILGALIILHFIASVDLSLLMLYIALSSRNKLYN